MTCATPNQEWTIKVTSDPVPNKQPLDQIIVFCLTVENGKINGAVSLSNGTFLSSVMGTNQPIMDLGINTLASLMTLIFTWGKANVTLSGFTFMNGLTRSFRGSFAAFESEALVARFASITDGANHPVLPTAPGDGDTGTGTGTQT